MVEREQPDGYDNRHAEDVIHDQDHEPRRRGLAQVVRARAEGERADEPEVHRRADVDVEEEAHEMTIIGLADAVLARQSARDLSAHIDPRT